MFMMFIIVFVIAMLIATGIIPGLDKFKTAGWTVSVILLVVSLLLGAFQIMFIMLAVGAVIYLIGNRTNEKIKSVLGKAKDAFNKVVSDAKKDSTESTKEDNTGEGDE